MIVLYSNHCPLCDNLKELLDKNNIDYELVDDVNKMSSLGINRTPMLQVEDGTLMKYKDALNWVKERV